MVLKELLHLAHKYHMLLILLKVGDSYNEFTASFVHLDVAP